MKAVFEQEVHSSAAATTAVLTALTPKSGKASRTYDRWFYGLIPGGGPNAQYFALSSDGNFLNNDDVEVPVERLGTVRCQPIMLPRALRVPANEDFILRGLHNKGTDEQLECVALWTRGGPPADIPEGDLYTLRQSLTASDEVLGGGTEVTVPKYGKGGGVTAELVAMGGHGAGATTLLVGVTSPELELTNNIGEAFMHVPGAADVGLGPIMHKPSEALILKGGDDFTPKAMDISGGTVIAYLWFIITGGR